MSENRPAQDKNLWIGIIIVVVGCFFLMRNFGIIPYHIDWDYIWPVAVIGVGFWFMFFKNQQKDE